MIKIRLLKELTSTTYNLLDTYDLGSEEGNIEELLIKGISHLIGKYQDLLSDPNIASSLINPTIKDWTIKDIMSIMGSLRLVGLRLIITSEQQDDVRITEKSVMYLAIDSSSKIKELIPFGQYSVLPYEPNMDSLSAIRRVISDTYFNKNKFLNDPVEALLSNLLTSKQLSGVYDPITFNKLYNLLNAMELEVLTIAISPEE